MKCLETSAEWKPQLRVYFLYFEITRFKVRLYSISLLCSLRCDTTPHSTETEQSETMLHVSFQYSLQRNKMKTNVTTKKLSWTSNTWSTPSFLLYIWRTLQLACAKIIYTDDIDNPILIKYSGRFLLFLLLYLKKKRFARNFSWRIFWCLLTS